MDSTRGTGLFGLKDRVEFVGDIPIPGSIRLTVNFTVLLPSAFEIRDPRCISCGAIEREASPGCDKASCCGERFVFQGRGRRLPGGEGHR